MLTKSKLEIKIAQAILRITSLNKKPSQEKVIRLIGGSFSTIGPIYNYLKEKFNNFTEPEKLRKAYNLEKVDPGQILTENEALKEQLKFLSEHNLTLETEQLKLKQQVVTLEHSERHYRGLYQTLVAERSETVKQMITDKEQQIQALLNELAATHREHTEQYRSFSFTYDDKLLQKELRIKELSTSLEQLQSKIAAYEKQTIPQLQSIKQLRSENLLLVNKIALLEQQLAVVGKE